MLLQKSLYITFLLKKRQKKPQSKTNSDAAAL